MVVGNIERPTSNEKHSKFRHFSGLSRLGWMNSNYESTNQQIIQLNEEEAVNSEEDYDFRNTRWGMSKEDVLASESGEPVVKIDTQIGYFTEILDKNIFVAFIFDNEHLVASLYALRDMREHLDDSFKDFEDFKKILIMKYGEPNAGQGDVWADPSFGGEDALKTLLLDRSKYEEALKQGRIIHAAMWKTDRTWIKVALSKMMEGHTCGVTVEYKSIRHLANHDPVFRRLGKGRISEAERMGG